MQNHSHMINKSIEYRKLLNDFYYYDYHWKDRLDRVTNYTHGPPLYKLAGVANHILETITTQVAIDNFKIVNIVVYIVNTLKPGDISFTDNYQNNISIMESFVINEANRKKISKYVFKIIENDKIFSVLDSKFNIIKHNASINSMENEGYASSSICINVLLHHFISLNN